MSVLGCVCGKIYDRKWCDNSHPDAMQFPTFVLFLHVFFPFFPVVVCRVFLWSIFMCRADQTEFTIIRPPMSWIKKGYGPLATKWSNIIVYFEEGSRCVKWPRSARDYGGWVARASSKQKCKELRRAPITYNIALDYFFSRLFNRLGSVIIRKCARGGS